MANLQQQVDVASGARPSSEVLRQLIEFAWHALATDAQSPRGFLVEECFSMWGDDVVATVKKYIVEHQNMPVIMGYPKDDLDIPQICVLAMAEDEDVERDVLGDQTGMRGRGMAYTTDPTTQEPVLKGVKVIQRRQLGMATKCVTNIYVRSEDSTLTIYLAFLVRLILFINKLQLIEDADIHNMVINIKEMTDDHPGLFPKFAFTKIVNVIYDSHFDYNLQEEMLKRLNFSILVNLAQIEPPDGDLHDEKAVKVPYST